MAAAGMRRQQTGNLDWTLLIASISGDTTFESTFACL